MIFQASIRGVESWRLILEGKKTQTRRPAKPQPRYLVGKTYAVQPARTHEALLWRPEHPCFGIDIIQPGDTHYELARSGAWPYAGQGYIRARVRVVAHRVEDVREISHKDAYAEGFGDAVDYIGWWIAHYDKTFWRNFDAEPFANDWLYYAATRKQEIYRADAYTFEVVK